MSPYGYSLPNVCVDAAAPCQLQTQVPCHHDTCPGEMIKADSGGSFGHHFQRHYGSNLMNDLLSYTSLKLVTS